MVLFPLYQYSKQIKINFQYFRLISFIKLLLLFFVFGYSELCYFQQMMHPCKISQNDLYLLRKASIFSENYKEVQTNQCFFYCFLNLIIKWSSSIVRKNQNFHPTGIEHNPLRNQLYTNPTLVKGYFFAKLDDSKQCNFYKHIKSILQGFGCGIVIADKQQLKYLQQHLIG
ncbi:unnamed protein product [Paramecium octaurelia]|uniref:Transmembrane protein n=1 Tax=Paramecium octaurelia TaxID=43137 RepID=A0A8S1XKC5_PAROT|nr:unnamed protein product [Paramecium octaurelia]